MVQHGVHHSDSRESPRMTVSSSSAAALRLAEPAWLTYSSRSAAMAAVASSSPADSLITR